MNRQNSSAIITTRRTSREYTYDRTTVLNLNIERPVVRLPNSKKAELRINQRYFEQANKFYRTVSNELYRQAVQVYLNSKQNDFPFHPFEAIMQSEIKLNEGCYLSSYSEKYQYTGGAHGITIRTSDTFSLKTGRLMSLSDFFPPGSNYQGFLLGQILMQADENMEQDPIYFDDYRELIIQNFNTSSFYLNQEGLVIYYQQYDIAPYVAGIIEFTIPYSILGWKPMC
jgi:hypothetical protein